MNRGRSFRKNFILSYSGVGENFINPTIELNLKQNRIIRLVPLWMQHRGPSHSSHTINLQCEEKYENALCIWDLSMISYERYPMDHTSDV